MRINIKPLSVNQSWQGKRFKTPKYIQYENDVLFMLPKLDIPKNILLELTLKVGFSNKASDLDNICKPFQDILQKKYGFNDSQIYRLVMEKVIVNKGNDFIEFEIKEL